MAGKRQRSRGTGTLFKRNGRGPWIARWFDCLGQRKEASTRTTDKAAAERILSKRTADAALRRDGVVDARSDRYVAANQRPTSEHRADWKATLLAKGVTAKQVTQLVVRVDKLLCAVEATRLSDLSASLIQTAIGELRDEGMALQTCHHYLRAIKQFSRWLKRDGRVRDDVLSHLTGYNASTDRRHERRSLAPDEPMLLFDAAESGPSWRGASGPDRAMAYRIATGTGFRAGELRSLTPASFCLDDNPPTIVLEAKHSKRRRADHQPIRVDLAEMLRSWLVEKPTGQPVFSTMPEKTALMVKADLRRARARWIKAVHDRKERRKRAQSDFLAEVNGAGHVVDFHALRVTYITLLIKSGASVREVQELARHSDPRLTLNIYTKLGIHDLAGALDGLPGLTADAPKRERIRRTGTDDAFAEASDDPRLKPRQLGRERVRSGATVCDEAGTEPKPLTRARPRILQDNATPCGPMRRNATKPPGGLEPSTCGLQNRCSTN